MTHPLLQPRFEVIADYPGNPHLIGTIYTLPIGDIEDMYVAINAIPFYESHFMRYPALFKRLLWWEYRKPEEMPTHVIINGVPERVHFFSTWGIGVHLDHVGGGCGGHYSFSKSILPATEEEYTEYINSQKTKK